MRGGVWYAFLVSVGLSFGVLPGGAARAQSYPQRYVQRPLVLPSSTLRFDAAFPLLSLDEPGGDRRNTFSALLGLGVGVGDELEIGGVFLPQQLSETFEYRNPSFYGIYRIVNERIIELALRGDLYFPFENQRDLITGATIPFLPWFGDVALGADLRLHIENAVRIDTGAHFGLVFTDPTGTRLTFPLEVAVQLTNSAFFGPQTGVQIIDGDEVNFPLGAFIGNSFGPALQPVLDLRGTFLLPAADEGFDAFYVGLGLNLYLYL